jgi:hypothetical protein
MDVITGMKAAETGLKLLSHLKEAAGKRIEPALLRMVYLELRRNIEILSAVNLDTEKDLPATDVAYAQAAASLDVQSLYALILALEEPGLIERVVQNSVNLLDLEVETNRERKRDSTPLPEAARYVYVKITSLQAISRLDERIRLDLRLRTRLRNIRANVRALADVLREHEDIRPIA